MAGQISDIFAMGIQNLSLSELWRKNLNGLPSARRQAQRQDMHPVFLFMSPEGPAY